jgi:hypothetical protein
MFHANVNFKAHVDVDAGHVIGTWKNSRNADVQGKFKSGIVTFTASPTWIASHGLVRLCPAMVKVLGNFHMNSLLTNFQEI